MMRLSFLGSSGWFASTYSSRLPLPLVSRISGVQPCDFFSSPVCSNILVFSHPTTPLAGLPALVHNVLLASLAKYRCWVEKHVSISVHLLVFGSNMESWRSDSSRGATLADARSEPALQYAGFSLPRIRAVNHTRPRSSYSGLWMLVWPSQIASSPQ